MGEVRQILQKMQAADNSMPHDSFAHIRFIFPRLAL
jgi:hypothetical protein